MNGTTNTSTPTKNQKKKLPFNAREKAEANGQ
jgi:hypothetical protein